MEEKKLLSPIKKILPPKGVYQGLLLWTLLFSVESFSFNVCSLPSTEEKNFLENLHQEQASIFSKTTAAETCSNKEASLFYIFVSFSLPDTTLKSLYRDTKRTGGKLVLRGLYQNSFKKTVVKLRELEIEIVIDPLIFRKYQITAVPTFLLLKEESAFQIRGHISVIYALQQMINQGNVAAKELLTQLEASR